MREGNLLRLKGKWFHNPARGAWGRVVGTISCDSYYMCEELSKPLAVMRVVYIGHMENWGFYRTQGEAQVAAETGTMGRKIAV